MLFFISMALSTMFAKLSDELHMDPSELEMPNIFCF